MARQIHEHAKRLRRGTGEGEGRVSHGRHLRSRHDDPRVEPHHSVHHGSADSAAPGPRFHPRRRPRLRTQLRYGCRVLGRPPYRVLLRPAYGSDPDLAEQPSPPLCRSPPSDDGPPRPPRNPAVDERGIRVQSPRGPALPLRELLVCDGPPPFGGRGSGRRIDPNGTAPDAPRTLPVRWRHPDLLPQSDPQSRGVHAVPHPIHPAGPHRCVLAAPRAEVNNHEDPGVPRSSSTCGAQNRKPPEGFEPPTCSSFGAGVFACTYETAALPG